MAQRVTALFVFGGLLALMAPISAYAYTLVADASASRNTNGVLPLQVAFSAANSKCDPAFSCQWHWNFGDGTSSDVASDASGALDVAHFYLVAGTYTVTLTGTLMTPTNPKPKASTTLVVTVAQGETLASYVNTCKTQLGFKDNDIPTNLNCTKGVLFAPPNPPVNDFFGYARVNDNVDLAFACRWLNNGDANGDTVPPFVKARSIELFITNRQTGKTCFFEARDGQPLQDGTIQTVFPPVSIVSPTVAAAAAPNTPEANFWDQPIELDRSVPCVDCHVAGPFISSPRIAPFLGQFGLLNNGHDTFGLTTDVHNNVVGNYQAVGTTFAHFNNMAAANNVVTSSTCANGCHSIGYNSTAQDIRILNVLIPSITSVIDPNDGGSPDISVATSGVMPPFDNLSNYHWVNLDTPTNSRPSTGVETENFADAMSRVANSIVPRLFHGYDGSNADVPSNPNCTHAGDNVPMQMDAHAVGVPNDYSFSTGTMALIPDRLRFFNLKEGLACYNSDQDSTQCHDYMVRYLCSVSNLDGTPTWSGWYNTDSPANDGDHEERSRDQNICGGAAPIAIQARVFAAGTALDIMGPNDRLARFSRYGLTCNASDQVDGQCSNYVARYDYCTAPPQTQWNKTLTNVFAVGKQLTAASGALVKGQAHNNSWNTQQWAIEPVTNTEYVRVHNVPTNVYLTVTSQTEQATVGTAGLNTSASEMWIVETVSGSSDFRLKNLFSGKYLTIQDPKLAPAGSQDFLAIYSQGLNTGWTSQRWIIQ